MMRDSTGVRFIGRCEHRSRRRAHRSIGRLVAIWSVLATACLSFLTGISAASDTAQLERTSQIVRTSVYTERTGRLVLERALSCFRSGDTIEGIAKLQELLDAPHDSFLHAGDVHSGVRQAAAEFLRNAPDSIRRLYAAAQEKRASTAFEQATAARDLAMLGEVVRRFPATRAAVQASDRLARIAFDRGDFGTAARLWQQLLVERLDAGDTSPDLVVKTISALRRAGRDRQASELTEQFSTVAILFDGTPTAVRSLSHQLQPATPSLSTSGLPCAVASRLAPPAFPPTWQHVTGVEVTRLVELWAGARESGNRPVATPAGSVIVGGKLFVREPSALVSYDLRSGSPTWRAELAAPSAEKSTDSDSRPNNLQELMRFEESYASHSALAAISTDGEHVFVVDNPVEQFGAVQTVSLSPALSQDDDFNDADTNRLLAYPVHSVSDSNPKPAWVVGGRTESPALGGHYFFGPPMSAEGRLLAITEDRQCLFLVALDPATGDLQWKQPLGFVKRPVGDDRLRAASFCPPAIADGVAVCATHAGFVVAVDFVTGRLLWAHEYAVENVGTPGGTTTSTDRTVHHGDPAFPSVPLVHDGRVVLLPQDSEQIHCLDLLTGEVHWIAPREDGLSVACVTDTSAIILGQSSVRSLSAVDGRSLWVSRLGTPAGTGIATDSTYLLPLETGTIAAVDLDTGHRVGFDAPRDAKAYRPLDDRTEENDAESQWRPGNLCTDGLSLFSVGPFGVMRLEAADAVLAGHDSPVNLLEQARLELAAGQLEPAQEHLESLRTEGEDDSSRHAATRLLQELHYLRLNEESSTARETTLAALDRLSVTPTERGRFLLNATARALPESGTEVFRQRISELAALRLDTPLAAPNDASHFVSAASWLHALKNRLPAHLESAALPAASLATVGDSELEAWLLCLPAGTRAAALQVELARRAIEEAEFHKAEMLLLQAVRHDSAAADARRMMTRLQDRCGLGDDPEPVTSTGHRIGSVQVSGELWSPADDALCQTFVESRRWWLTRGRNPFRIVDRGDTRQARLEIVDLQRGLRLGEVAIDARLRFPSLDRQPLASHFVPVATAERVYGLSYLNVRSGGLAWQADLPGGSGFLPQIGPYGPSFCTLQTKSDLTVLDSATGETLWRRTELPVDRHGSGQRSTELFGDEVALVLLDGERSRYTVYDTRTGDELSQGRLPISELRQSRSLGRRFFYVETGETHSIAHLWDPVTGEDDLAVTFTGSLLETTTRNGDLVLLFGDGRLFVVNPQDARRSLRLSLDPRLASQVGHVQAFCDTERFYISLAMKTDAAPLDEANVTQYVYDTPLAMNHVRGRLIAVDRNSEAVVWSRPTGPQSILDPVDHPAPILVGVARVSDRNDRTRQSLLVEAIDRQTGATLGRNGNLVHDQLLQARYEPEKDRVVLAGTTSTVVLDIARESSDFRLAGRTQLQNNRAN